MKTIFKQILNKNPLFSNYVTKIGKRFLPYVLLLFIILIFSTVNVYAQNEKFSIHHSSFKQANYATKEIEKLRQKGHVSFYKLETIPGKGEWYRVYIGKFSTKDEARREGYKLKKAGEVSYLNIISIKPEKKAPPIKKAPPQVQAPIIPIQKEIIEEYTKELEEIPLEDEPEETVHIEPIEPIQKEVPPPSAPPPPIPVKEQPEIMIESSQYDSFEDDVSDEKEAAHNQGSAKISFGGNITASDTYYDGKDTENTTWFAQIQLLYGYFFLDSWEIGSSLTIRLKATSSSKKEDIYGDLQALLKKYFINKTRYIPYVGIQAGGHMHGDTETDETTTSFSWGFLYGVEKMINENTSFYFEHNWLATSYKMDDFDAEYINYQNQWLFGFSIYF